MVDYDLTEVRIGSAYLQSSNGLSNEKSRFSWDIGISALRAFEARVVASTANPDFFDKIDDDDLFIEFLKKDGTTVRREPARKYLLMHSFSNLTNFLKDASRDKFLSTWTEIYKDLIEAYLSHDSNKFSLVAVSPEFRHANILKFAKHDSNPYQTPTLSRYRCSRFAWERFVILFVDPDDAYTFKMINSDLEIYWFDLTKNEKV